MHQSPPKSPQEIYRNFMRWFADQMDPYSVDKPVESQRWGARLKKYGNAAVSLLGNVVPLPEEAWLLRPDFLLGDSEKGVLQDPGVYGLNGFNKVTLTVRDADPKKRDVLTAWYHKGDVGMPAIAYCHGNAGALNARKLMFEEFAKKGFTVMAVAYPGYKGSEGTPARPQEASGEGCLRAARAMIAALEEEGLPTEKIALFGKSFGGAVAVNTAEYIESQGKKLGALVTLATFASTHKRFQDTLPYYPERMIKNRLNSEGTVPHLKTPTLIMHGMEDEVTHHKHSQMIHDAARRSGKDGEVKKGNLRLVLLEERNHSLRRWGTSAPDPVQVAEAVEIVCGFLQEHISYNKPALAGDNGNTRKWQGIAAGNGPEHSATGRR